MMKIVRHALMTVLPLASVFALIAACRADASQTQPALPPHVADPVAAKFHRVSLRPVLGGCLPTGSLACAGEPSPQVTTHIKAMTLPEALKEISRLTGVPLSASAATADIKVTILVKDLPLDILRARLAETLHLSWITHEADKAQPTSYLIYRSPQNSAEELELRAQGERAFRKGIDEAIGALSLPPEARVKLFAERKALAETFSNGGREVAVTLLSHLSPHTRTSIMDGNKLEFPSDRPPPELAPHIDAIMKAFMAALGDDAFGRNFRQPDKLFTIERIGEGARGLIRVTLSVQGGQGFASAGFQIAGVRPEEIYPAAYAPNHTGPAYMQARLPVDVPTALTAASLDSLLERVADTLHINIVGESYWQYVPKHGKPEPVYFSSVPAGSATIGKALDAVLVQNYWWKQGDVYLYQRPLWWEARRADVPDPTRAYLAKILQRQPLSFEDAAEVCKTLSAEQWRWLIPRYLTDSGYLTPVQTVLRFYGYLPPARKAELFREGGTEATLLAEADQLRLKTWIAETNREGLHRVQNMPGKIQIVATRLPQDVKQGPVVFRAVFQAKDGTKTLLREQYVPARDPSEMVESSFD